MTDMRKTPDRRGTIFTVKLSDQEAQDLQQLAAAEHRRPGDQLRHLLALAVEARRAAAAREQP
jgi:predicted transcriptional regulator